MRQEALTTVKGGLSRQRTKGGALKDQLYDLLNGYVTSEKTVRSRPGTTLSATLPAGTVGLIHHNGTFNVFASSLITGLPTGYTLKIVRAPDEAALSKIHFAEPFLGKLYVVAEFADGDIYHYWIKDSEEWEASTEYQLADVVTPSTANGYTYIPKRSGKPYPTWTPGVNRTVGDKVEPTSFNGYYFEVVTASGGQPRSGLTEPGWATDPHVVAGKRYVESVDGTYSPPQPTPPPDRDRRPPLDDDLEERYGRTRWAANTRRYLR